MERSSRVSLEEKREREEMRSAQVRYAVKAVAVASCRAGELGRCGVVSRERRVVSAVVKMVLREVGLSSIM